jgi:hypothetical protein
MADPRPTSDTSPHKRVGIHVFLRLFLLQAGGMLVAILMAMLCSWNHDPIRSTWTSETVDGRPVIRDWFWPVPGPAPDYYAWCTSIGYSNELLIVTPQPPLVGRSQVRIRSGLPFRCLETSDHNVPPPPTRFKLGPFRLWSLEYGGYFIKDTLSAVVVVPLMPTWPGLILDGAIFGAILAVIIAPVSAMRRRRRMLRGECLHCGYALVGLPKCPECGTIAGSGT